MKHRKFDLRKNVTWQWLAAIMDSGCVVGNAQLVRGWSDVGEYVFWVGGEG